MKIGDRIHTGDVATFDNKTISLIKDIEELDTDVKDKLFFSSRQVKHI